MKILAIETATEACSAALLISGEANQIEKNCVRFRHAPREHTKLILSMMDEVLEEAGTDLREVDAIAFGRGPGAFTGLRIASGIAQGVALSVGKPVVPVSTLATLAQSVVDKLENDQSIIVALDARMNEVYWGEFILNKGMLAIRGQEQVSPLQTLLDNMDTEQKIIAIGNGWEAYLADTPQNITQIKGSFPSAQQVAELALPLLLSGNSLPPEGAQPVYIRNNVAEKPRKLS
ncbi:MAG: tRNA (adenosine(37)-N6)-threonylcarbamoyltransferase complex dimerization subunit type 1 TsaB [Cocleimonas sp.]